VVLSLLGVARVPESQWRHVVEGLPSKDSPAAATCRSPPVPTACWSANRAWQRTTTGSTGLTSRRRRARLVTSDA
jgi:hypothetical protein